MSYEFERGMDGGRRRIERGEVAGRSLYPVNQDDKTAYRRVSNHETDLMQVGFVEAHITKYNLPTAMLKAKPVLCTLALF